MNAPTPLKAGIPLMLLAAIGLFWVGQHLFSPHIPATMMWSDSVGYLTTAHRIKRSGRVATGLHRSEDLARYQSRDYRPIHKPMYALALSVWLSAFPTTKTAFLFNRILYLLLLGALLLVLWRMLALHTPQLLYTGIFLACSPLAFAFSHTLMMETFVLAVGALLWLLWFAPLPTRWQSQQQATFRICALLLWTLVAYMTRPTLVGVTIAILMAHPRLWWQRQRKTTQKRWRRRLLLLALIASLLAILIWEMLQPKATYPNFLSTLLDQKTLLAALTRLMRHLGGNLSAYVLWKDPAHDVLHIYTWCCLLTNAWLVWRHRHQRRSLSFRTNAVALLFWFGALGLIWLLYDNFAWRSHRVLMINVLLSHLGFLVACFHHKRGGLRRQAWMGVWLVLQISFGLFRRSTSRDCVQHRSLQRWPGSSSPGALVVAFNGWPLAIHNPWIELVYNNAQGSQLWWVVRTFKPVLVVTRGRLPFQRLGYRRWRTKAPKYGWIWERRKHQSARRRRSVQKR